MADTSTKLEENVASLLCYVLGWVTGIVFLILEPENKTVRFHAWQSIIFFGACSIVMAVFGWIPIFGMIVYIVVGIAAFIAWIVLIVKAYGGVKYKIPIAGDMAEKWAG